MPWGPVAVDFMLIPSFRGVFMYMYVYMQYQQFEVLVDIYICDSSVLIVFQSLSFFI